MASSQPWTLTVTPEDKAFHRAMGQRIAARRKSLNITQVQLAESLGIAQQTVAHYESGRLRVSVTMLPALARELAVSVEELLGEIAGQINGNGKRGPTPKLQRQLEQIARLPRAKQRFVMDMLDTVLQQRG